MNDAQRRKASEEWNQWRPGKSGCKSWSPFDNPIPPVRDSMDRPLRPDGFIDTKKWIEEVNEGKWPRR